VTTASRKCQGTISRVETTAVKESHCTEIGCWPICLFAGRGNATVVHHPTASVNPYPSLSCLSTSSFRYSGNRQGNMNHEDIWANHRAPSDLQGAIWANEEMKSSMDLRGTLPSLAQCPCGRLWWNVLTWSRFDYLRCNSIVNRLGIFFQTTHCLGAFYC
jgi:hypothetical protein